MHIKDAKDIIYIADPCGHVPLFVGLHGIGKSEAVSQYAKENNMHYEVLILSLMDESDLLGIPYKEDFNGEICVTWAPPKWFSRIMEAHKRGQRSVLFLDELNRASQSVIGASLQLILDKRLNDHIMPKDSLIVAAINPEDNDYNVNSLDPAVLDRLIVCDIEPDALAWIEWAKQTGVNKTVIDFIISNPNKIHHINKDGSKGASPRSWTKLATYINLVEKQQQQDLNTYYVKGTIGETLAAEFLLFYNNYISHITYQDVINLYNNNKNKSFNDIVSILNSKVENLEAIQRIDLANNLENVISSEFDKFTISYKDDSSKLEYPDNYNKDNILFYLVYLYTLPIESLAAYLKTLKSQNTNFYMKLASFDGEINNKKLFKKLIN